MSSDSSYVEYLQELMSGLGAVGVRRMFGGYGIYHDGLMIAVVVEQRLYLKVDDATRATFAAAGCEAWIYEGKAKPVQMSYWSVPDEAMDSSEAMTPWARRAFAAALRKANAKPVARPKVVKKAVKEAPAAASSTSAARKTVAAKPKPAARSKTGAGKPTRKPRG